MPAEVFIGEAPKRSQPVRPPNQSALNRRAAPRADAQKRGASYAAEDRRTKPRGGAANAERAERRDAVYARQARMDKAAQRQVARGDKKAANERLYQDSQGNVKAKRPAKKAKTKKSVSQSMSSFSPTFGSRPEDRYGVRRQNARGKSLASASASRERQRVGFC